MAVPSDPMVVASTPGDDQPAQAAGHHVDDEIWEDPRAVRMATRHRQRRIVHHVAVIHREQDADGQHGEGDGNVGQSG